MRIWLSAGQRFWRSKTKEKEAARTRQKWTASQNLLSAAQVHATEGDYPPRLEMRVAG
jgi:hypothetical protein